MSQKPLAFLLSLFGADQNLLTKRCMFGKGDRRGQLYRRGFVTGDEGWGGWCVCLCLCVRGRMVMVGGSWQGGVLVLVISGVSALKLLWWSFSLCLSLMLQNFESCNLPSPTTTATSWVVTHAHSSSPCRPNHLNRTGQYKPACVQGSEGQVCVRHCPGKTNMRSPASSPSHWSTRASTYTSSTGSWHRTQLSLSALQELSADG